MKIEDIKIGKKYYWNNYYDNVTKVKVIMILDKEYVLARHYCDLNKVHISKLISSGPSILSKIFSYWI